MEKTKSVRAFLREERKRQNKSRGWLARETGLCENTIYQFERNPDYNTTTRTLKLIAGALGYEIEIRLVPKKVDK